MTPGLSFDAMSTVQATVAEARAAEAAGARSLWVASHLFFRDPFGLAMAILQATQRATVLPMAVSPYTMHPLHAAMAAATLDEVAPGRAALCLGSGNPVDLAEAGRGQDRPVRTLREAVEICRRLLAGEALTFDGEVFRMRGRKLHPTPGAPIPIYLTAMGEQMFALGGAVADGVLLSAGCSVEFVRHARAHVERGAGKRKVTLAGLVLTALSEDEGAALERHRRRLGFLLRGKHHEPNLRLAGTAVDREALVVRPHPGEVLEDVDPRVVQRLPQAVDQAHGEGREAEEQRPQDHAPVALRQLEGVRVLDDGVHSTITFPNIV